MSATSERGALWSILERPAVYEAFEFLIGARAWRRQFVLDVLQVKDGDRVLDIGCGTGALLAPMPQRVSYVGIDRNTAYIDSARAKFGDRGTFTCCGVADMRWDIGRSFDVIFALGLLHHLEDDEARQLLLDVAKIAGDARIVFADHCFDPRQSALQRFVASIDRGTLVRTFDDGFALCREAFPHASAEYKAGYNPFPWTLCIVTAAEGVHAR